MHGGARGGHCSASSEGHPDLSSQQKRACCELDLQTRPQKLSALQEESALQYAKTNPCAAAPSHLIEPSNCGARRPLSPPLKVQHREPGIGLQAISSRQRLWVTIAPGARPRRNTKNRACLDPGGLLTGQHYDGAFLLWPCRLHGWRSVKAKTARHPLQCARSPA